MSSGADNLILEDLRAIRSDMSRMADEMRTMHSEMTALRHHVSGVVTIQEHDHGDIATLKARLARIERRLDLVE